MADWTKLVPASGPERVERARQAVEKLEARVPQQREALQAAKAAIIEAEADDRRKMADAIRKGRAAQADVHAVAQAREHAAGVQRETEALTLAIQTAQDDLGDAVHQARGEWAKTAERRQHEARGHARSAIDELEIALGDLGLARSTLYWLTAEDAGLDRQTRAPNPALGWAEDSARVTGNAEPLPLIQLIAWLRDAVAEPAPPRPQPAAPLQPAHP